MTYRDIHPGDIVRIYGTYKEIERVDKTHFATRGSYDKLELWSYEADNIELIKSNKMIQVKFKKLHKDAKLPEFKHEGDAGKDLYATSLKYNPKYDRYEYGLGFATEIPEGYQVSIRPRSSNTKTNAYLPNSVGLIDSNYRGEWFVFYKLRTSPNMPVLSGPDDFLRYAPYQIGDAVAQCMLEKVLDWEFIEVDELSDSERGADGGLIRDDKNFK